MDTIARNVLETDAAGVAEILGVTPDHARTIRARVRAGRALSSDHLCRWVRRLRAGGRDVSVDEILVHLDRRAGPVDGAAAVPIGRARSAFRAGDEAPR